jgi:ribosome-associated heat shock protein Hsp15
MSAGLRLDKFLWHARFAKTRSAAARLIEDGDVLLDGHAVKPAQTVHIGDRVSIRLGRFEQVIEIRALGERRGPAAEARSLYVELAKTAVKQIWDSLLDDAIE